MYFLDCLTDVSEDLLVQHVLPGLRQLAAVVGQHVHEHEVSGRHANMYMSTRLVVVMPTCT